MSNLEALLQSLSDYRSTYGITAGQILQLIEIIRVQNEALKEYAKESDFVAWAGQSPEFKILYKSMKETWDKAASTARNAINKAEEIAGRK